MSGHASRLRAAFSCALVIAIQTVSLPPVELKSSPDPATKRHNGRRLTEQQFCCIFARMPATDVIYYREVDGSVPVLDCLKEIQRRNPRAVVKVAAGIDILRQQGHELRRPIADYVRDGIYELRTRSGRVQCRILYFFHGRNAVVLAHGLVKEREVPKADIERAISRKRKFALTPERHSYREDATNG